MNKVLILLIALLIPLMASASAYTDSSGLIQVIDTASDPPDFLSGEPVLAVIGSDQSYINVASSSHGNVALAVGKETLAVLEVSAPAGSISLLTDDT